MKRFAPIFTVLACGIAAAVIGASSPEIPRAITSRGIAESPVCFEQNRGQADGPAQFLARNQDCAVLLSTTEATLVIAKGNSSRRVRLSFAGANPNAKISGLDPLTARANYFLGDDSTQWRAGVPLFSRVQLDDIYPGAQLIFYPSKSARLEYDFVLQPGVDPKQIALQISGADRVFVDRNGDLILKIGRDEVRQPKPVTYQTRNGTRKEIASAWRLTGKNTAAFSVGEFDPTLPLVIDPGLDFSTYLGGSLGERGWDIATDPNGNVYICGDTFSLDLRTNFSTAPFLIYSNGFTGVTNSGTQGLHQCGDAFVAKFTPTGPSNTLELAFLTYLGGRGQDAALGIAADATGAYITGFTDSPNFPTTTNAAYPHINGVNQTASKIYRADAFVTKIDPNGTNLIYSSYLGGNERDSGNAIAVDASGSAYVAGFTQSTNFPVGTNLSWVVTNRYAAATNSNVAQPRFGGLMDGFISKIAADGSKLIYSTFLGGTNNDSITSIKVDSAGAAYVTGYTLSTNFPTMPTNNTMLNGITNRQVILNFDGFFTKLSADGSAFEYSRFLGGESTDVPLRLALIGSTDVLISGYTYSTNFPTTRQIPNTRVWTNFRTNSNPDIFVTRLHQLFDGTNFIYSTNAPGYSVEFGGKAVDQVTGLAADAAGNAVIAGITSSTNLFNIYVVTNLIITNSHHVVTNITVTNYDTGLNILSLNMTTNKFKRATNNVFVAVLNSDASAFTYAALLGGAGDDLAHGIAVSALNTNVYIVGNTTSSNFPTMYPLESRLNVKRNTNDVFVATISLASVLPSPQHLVRSEAVAVEQPPTLFITQSNGVVTLTWPESAPGFVPECASNPAGNWQPVLLPQSTNSGWISLTLSATNTSSFFRLKKP